MKKKNIFIMGLIAGGALLLIFSFAVTTSTTRVYQGSLEEDISQDDTRPNLIIEYMEVVGGNSPYNLVATIKNIGLTAAGASQDSRIGFLLMEKLYEAPGPNISIPFATIVETIEAGDYVEVTFEEAVIENSSVITLQLDVGNAVDESNEDDNLKMLRPS